MIMTRNGKIGFVLFVALIVGLAGGAQATTFNLGSVSGPALLPVGDTKLPGPFTGNYYFSIDPGVSLVFSALVDNYYWRHGAISDMDGTLNGPSGIIATGNAFQFQDINLPYPQRRVIFASLALGPGTYHLSIFGTAVSDVGTTNDYSGTITLTATPLPASLLLLLTGLGGIGLLGRSRIGAKAAS